MTVTAQFAAPVARVWAAYADPSQLERFWGPRQSPAKFERHDFTVGGRSEDVMTGPNGETSRGFWEFPSIDEPRAFEVKDGFLGPAMRFAPCADAKYPRRVAEGRPLVIDWLRLELEAATHGCVHRPSTRSARNIVSSQVSDRSSWRTRYVSPSSASQF